MSYLDLVLLGLVAGFVIGGWRTGFVRRLASLGFLVVAFVAAAYLREPIAGLISVALPSAPAENTGFVGFVVAFGLVLAALHLGTRRFLERVALTGLSRAADRALGAGLGAAESILYATIGIVIVTTYAGDAFIRGITELGLIPDSAALLAESTIVRILMDTTAPLVLTILGPLLPPDITAVLELLPD